jgi:hypothetical protein
VISLGCIVVGLPACGQEAISGLVNKAASDLRLDLDMGTASEIRSNAVSEICSNCGLRDPH